MLCLPSIASVVLALGPPAANEGTTPELPPGGAAPLRAPIQSPPPARASAWLPGTGVAPLSKGATVRAQAPPSALPAGGAAPLRAPVSGGHAAPAPLPAHGVTPLDVHPAATGRRAEVSDPWATGRAPTIAAPFGSGPSLAPERPDPRTLRVVRIELLAGPVWRIKTTETLVLASVEAGRLHGFSGTFHVGMFVAPDRGFVAANDFPIGGGFVARRRLGERSLFASVGLSAGILVHRAATDLGVVHRVDPDFQLPLRFGWTAGRVGFSVALLQGFSVRTRTYSRRGIEVWKRIPYRIGIAVGLHFDIGAGQAKPRGPDPRRGATP